MSKIQSRNPYTENLNQEFDTISRTDLDQKISCAHEAYLVWKDTPKVEKKRLMLAFANTIEKHRENLARIQTEEMGMLYSASYAGL